MRNAATTLNQWMVDLIWICVFITVNSKILWRPVLMGGLKQIQHLLFYLTYSRQQSDLVLWDSQQNHKTFHLCLSVSLSLSLSLSPVYSTFLSLFLFDLLHLWLSFSSFFSFCHCLSVYLFLYFSVSVSHSLSLVNSSCIHWPLNFRKYNKHCSINWGVGVACSDFKHSHGSPS